MRQKRVFLLVEDLRGPEVSDFYVVIFVQQDVLGFEVEVDHFFAVYVSHRGDQLSRVASDLLLRQVPMLGVIDLER